jgi:hypothetical protein
VAPLAAVAPGAGELLGTYPGGRHTAAARAARPQIAQKVLLGTGRQDDGLFLPFFRNLPHMRHKAILGTSRA